MEVTALGYLVIPIGIVLFFKGTRYLMWALVISAPFFAASIAQLSFWTTTIRPYFYLGGLLIARKAVDMMLGHKNVDLSAKETRCLLAFLFAVLLSLLMPVLLEGKVDVLDVEICLDAALGMGLERSANSLALRRTNLTQTVYPVFMVLLFFAMVSEIKTPKQLHQILKINVAMAVIVVLSGIFYQIAMATGKVEVVDRLYVLLSGKEEIRRHALVFGVLPRMYSIVGESGRTGAYLLFAMGQAIIPVIANRSDLLWGRQSWMAFSFLSLGLLLTAGTAGYIGIPLFLAALLLLSGLQAKFKRKNSFRVKLHILILLIPFCLLVYVLFAVFFKTSLYDYVYQVHINKVLARSGSGIVRYDSAKYALGLFWRYPILGVGIGSNRTLDITTGLLSNVGLLGTVPFFLFNWIVFRKGMEAYRKTTDANLTIIVLALLVSFASFFGVMILSTTIAVLFYMYYWLLLAMIIAAHRFYTMEPKLPSSCNTRNLIERSV